MNNFLRNAKFAALSFACLIAGYVASWLYSFTGTSRALGYPEVSVVRFATLSPCLIAIVLALASVIWNPRKVPGILALAASVIGTWVLFRMAG